MKTCDSEFFSSAIRFVCRCTFWKPIKNSFTLSAKIKKKYYCKIESLTIDNNMYISKNCTDRSQNDTFVRNNYTCETFRWFDRLFESSNNLFRPTTSLWVWNSDSVFNNEHWNPPTKHYNVVRIVPIPFVHVNYRWINIWVWCELM